MTAGVLREKKKERKKNILLEEPSWQLFVCFCMVCGFEEEDSLENLHFVFFRLIKKRSVNLLWVLNQYSKEEQANDA